MTSWALNAATFAAVRRALVALGLSTSKRGAYARPLAKPYLGALKSFSPGFVAAG